MPTMIVNLLFLNPTFLRRIGSYINKALSNFIIIAQASFSLCVAVLLLALFVPPLNAQSSLQIYTSRTKTPVQVVPGNSQYKIVERQNGWNIIEFSQPTISVWVSAKHIEVNKNTGIAKVLTDQLNARMTPSFESKVISQINLGYESQAISISNGFVNIYAPINFRFAIDSSQLNNNKLSNFDSSINPVQQNNSKWIVQSDSTAILQTNSLNQEGSNRQVPSQINVLDKQSEQPSTNSSTVLTQTDFVPTSIVTNSNNQYRLASGDSISVTVFGENDLNIPATRIPQSGAISFPLIGSLPIVGKTTQEVERELIQAFSQGYINNPRLTVTIEAYRPIFIRGAVSSTGAFSYTEGLTVSQALSLAGGTTRAAKTSGVSLERNGRIIYQGLSLSSSQQVVPGDILTVDEEIGVTEEGQLLYVYLHGEVNRPGEYQFRPDLTVEKAVVLAGGFSLRAAKSRVSVSRYTDDQEVPEVMKRVPLYLLVQPGDIINVGASWF